MKIRKLRPWNREASPTAARGKTASCIGRSAYDEDEEVTNMEIRPIESASRLFPTKICRDGEWVVAVPIAISFAEGEASGVFKKLRRRVTEQRRRVHALFASSIRQKQIAQPT